MGLEPIYLGYAALVLSAVGTGVSVHASHQQGKAQKAAAEAQAQQDRQQADIAKAQAEVQQISGEQEARKRYAMLNQDIGTLYSQFAGNGVSLTSGTVGKALSTTVEEGVADVKTINDTTNMNVWASLNNATQLLNQSSVTQFQGRAAKRNGNLTAIGTGISGVGSAISAGAAGWDLGDRLNTKFGNGKVV